MSELQQRHYIRHPADIPISVSAAEASEDEKTHTQNVSIGGLCFISDKNISLGSRVHVKIDSVTPIFNAECEVAWTKKSGKHYEVGLKFISKDEAYRARMVQQVCHIEQFRRELSEQRGSPVSRDEAAKLWIDQHASNFPNFLDTNG